MTIRCIGETSLNFIVGGLRLQLAETDEERFAAQRLRYRVFFSEMDATPAAAAERARRSELQNAERGPVDRAPLRGLGLVPPGVPMASLSLSAPASAAPNA